MQSKLTLIGLYNYDNTLLDGLSFPSGIEKDLAISEILLRCGEFELLYPNFEFLKIMCQQWSRKHYRTFEKWVRALAIDYNPLDNYDRHEEYTDTMNGGETFNGSDSHTGSDTVAQSGTDTGSISNSTTGSTSPAQTTTTDTKSVSAFDSATFQNKEQEVSGLAVNTAGSDSSTTTGSTSTVYGKTEGTTYDSEIIHDNETTRNHTITHDAHLYGNIGVTTSQEMLKAELDVQRFNIYENIADIFCDEFCIMIY